MSKKKTHEEYVSQVKELSPYIEVRGKYIDARTSIIHFCNKHNMEWSTAPGVILNGGGCPECKKEKIHRKQALSNEQYVQMVAKSNPDVVPVETYYNMSTPIDHYHKSCGHTTKMTPYIVLEGCGCVLCKGKKISQTKARSQEEFCAEMLFLQPTIKILSKFENVNEKIDCKCLVCGYSWSPRPNHLLEGHGCPRCAFDKNADNLRKSHEQFLEELSQVNPYVVLKGKYRTYDKKVECQCTECGHVWSITPAMLMRGRGCPKCKESSGERRIRAFLEQHGILFTKDKRFKGLVGLGNKPLSYDFYLPTYNLLVEFQGEQHDHVVDLYGGENQFKTQKEHDRRKYNYAISNGYEFLEINYRDMNKIESILEGKINTLKSETVTTTGAV